MNETYIAARAEYNYRRTQIQQSFEEERRRKARRRAKRFGSSH